MMWTEAIAAIPEAVKSIFGIVDKCVVDKDRANEIKLSVLEGVMGTGSQHWLQANAFSIAMLVNYGMVITLTLTDRAVPEWALLVVLVWLAGPLINGLSKDTIGKLIELAKHKEEENGKKQ